MTRTSKLLAAALAGGAGTLFALMARGRCTLDTGWGRSLTPLGPITIRCDAPRELVFDVIAAPYLGRSSREARAHVRVWERGADLVVASHLSRLQGYTAETVEAVRFERPERVSFRHLRGPVPHAAETFTLSEDDGVTTLRYEGEVGLDFWGLGRLAARRWVVPTWEGVVRESLDGTRRAAEERAAVRARRRPVPGDRAQEDTSAT